MVPLADRLYDEHLAQLEREGLIIHALGGDLELIVRFPDADVRITQFGVTKKRVAANG